MDLLRLYCIFRDLVAQITEVVGNPIDLITKISSTWREHTKEAGREAWKKLLKEPTHHQPHGRVVAGVKP